MTFSHPHFDAFCEFQFGIEEALNVLGWHDDCFHPDIAGNDPIRNLRNILLAIGEKEYQTWLAFEKGDPRDPLVVFMQITQAAKPLIVRSRFSSDDRLVRCAQMLQEALWAFATGIPQGHLWFETPA